MTTKCMDDWPTTVSKYREMFNGKAAPVTMKWRLGGYNMMSSEILGWLDVDGEMVEVSTGIGLNHERIFGITFNRTNDDLPNDRDTVLFSLEEVDAYLYGDFGAFLDKEDA